MYHPFAGAAEIGLRLGRVRVRIRVRIRFRVRVRVMVRVSVSNNNLSADELIDKYHSAIPANGIVRRIFRRCSIMLFIKSYTPHLSLLLQVY